MAGASLLALLDDITSVLDDVAALTKVATGKTAGVVGDDLALNAQQVSGVRAERELPVVWAVAKGSLVNKAILVPAALAISALAPWAVTPLLMLGGLYLCYEGFEKIAHGLGRHRGDNDAAHAALAKAVADPTADLVAVEKDKIRGAIRTDFVLSAEIVTIALGIVASADLATRVIVLTGIALMMTVGVYGLVAGIVRLDDAGLHLYQSANAAARAVGRGILASAPYLMKALSVAGTAAMFLVGGGILAHGFSALQRHLDSWADAVDVIPPLEPLVDALLPLLLDAIAGVVAGALAYVLVAAAQRVRRRAVGARHG
jgi:predicted DNA repair protein MutK